MRSRLMPARRVWRFGFIVLLAGVVAAMVAGTHGASGAVTVKKTFSKPGVYAWTVPAGMTKARSRVLAPAAGTSSTTTSCWRWVGRVVRRRRRSR